MPGVFGCIIEPIVGQECASESAVGAWVGNNIELNGGRSAFANYLAGQSFVRPLFFHFGTGTAVPKASDTALQFTVTSKAINSSWSAIGASGLTARFYCALGAIEMTGIITEVLVGGVGHSFTPTALMQMHAKALINGGTGVTHPSGFNATFYWDFVLGTGQQPF